MSKSKGITFCSDKCRRKTCPRHQSRITFPNIPHSFASFKNTAECPKTKTDKKEETNADE
ncbi:MAG: hypothetical protein J6J93_01350 [Muribaculaceae bacterium]|nr:hypothetical protein [Muribaculaceae bacterium]